MNQQPPWLKQLLAITGAQCITRIQTIQSLWKGYGQLVRVHLKEGRQPTVVIKHIQHPAVSSDDSLSHQRKVKSYQVERAWYSHWSQDCPSTSKVPECLGQAQTGNSQWIILEDLDASGYPLRKNNLTETDIYAVLKWLAHFHAQFLGVVAPDLWPIGTYWHLTTRPDEWAILPEGLLKQNAAKIDQRLNDGYFMTLVHGDAKRANFCFGPAGVAAVDFQYIGRGCGMKDVAYFLNSCLSEEACFDAVRRYLAVYFEHLRSILPPTIDKTALEAEWRELFPLAWTDYYRFELGWGSGAYGPYPYSMALAEIAFKLL